MRFPVVVKYHLHKDKSPVWETYYTQEQYDNGIDSLKSLNYTPIIDHKMTEEEREKKRQDDRISIIAAEEMARELPKD